MNHQRLSHIRELAWRSVQYFNRHSPSTTHKWAMDQIVWEALLSV